MRCPKCKGPTKVVNTARYEEGKLVVGTRMAKQLDTEEDCILRRRRCLKCLERFTTGEFVTPDA